MTHMTVTRLKKAVDKQTEFMTRYIPEDKKKKPRLDPNYNLKGAARPALDFYKDPNFDYNEPVAVNLMEQYKEGKMWQHTEGQKLLATTLELGVALHNLAHKSKDAIKTFKQILEMDTADHLQARHALLRCYLDEGYGLEARALIEQFPEDSSACFTFGLALLDHVAYFINEEEGCTLEAANASLAKAFEQNNYAAWVIALFPFFAECVELTDELLTSVSTEEGVYCKGGILDALLFFAEDAQIWTDTEGAVEWVTSFLKSNKLEFVNPGTLLGTEEEVDVIKDDHNEQYEEEAPVLVPASTAVSQKRKNPEEFEEEEEGEGDDVGDFDDDDAVTKANAEIMYIGMYRTAVLMAKVGDPESSTTDTRAVAVKLLKHLHTLPIFENT